MTKIIQITAFPGGKYFSQQGECANAPSVIALDENGELHQLFLNDETWYKLPPLPNE